MVVFHLLCSAAPSLSSRTACCGAPSTWGPLTEQRPPLRYILFSPNYLSALRDCVAPVVIKPSVIYSCGSSKRTGLSDEHRVHWGRGHGQTLLTNQKPEANSTCKTDQGATIFTNPPLKDYCTLGLWWCGRFHLNSACYETSDFRMDKCFGQLMFWGETIINLQHKQNSARHNLFVWCQSVNRYVFAIHHYLFSVMILLMLLRIVSEPKG